MPVRHTLEVTKLIYQKLIPAIKESGTGDYAIRTYIRYKRLQK